MSAKKVVINVCFGGFGLSWAAMQEIAKRKGLVASYFHLSPDIHASVYGGKPVDPDDTFTHRVVGPRAVSAYSEMGEDHKAAGFLDARDFARDDADLVAVVEQMGDAASAMLARLKVVEIPADVSYVISDYDGSETVEEEHRSWR